MDFENLMLCRAKVLLTATGSMRGKKPILLKQIADEGVDIAARQGFQVYSALKTSPSRNPSQGSGSEIDIPRLPP